MRTRRPMGSRTPASLPRPRAGVDSLGECILEWEDIRDAPDPHALALEFARVAFHHACVVCEWDSALLASAEGAPPPVT